MFTEKNVLIKQLSKLERRMSEDAAGAARRGGGAGISLLYVTI